MSAVDQLRAVAVATNDATVKALALEAADAVEELEGRLARLEAEILPREPEE